MTPPSTDADEPITYVDVEVRTTRADVARALDAVARSRAPFTYVAQTILVLVIASCVLFGVVASIASDEAHGLGIGALVFVPVLAFILPWSRHRLFALALERSSPALYEPITIVGFTRHALRSVKASTEGESNLDLFPIRLETKHLFVLAREGGAGVFVLPKRAFTDPAALEAFRRVILTPASTTTLSDALHTFGESPSAHAVRYTLDPAEHTRGIYLYTGPKRVWGGALLLLVLLCALYGRQEPRVMALSFVFFTGALAFAFWRRHARLRAQLLPTSLELSDESLRMTTSGGTYARPWRDFVGLIDDARVLVVVADKGICVFVPTRALDVTSLATLRTKLPPYRR